MKVVTGTAIEHVFGSLRIPLHGFVSLMITSRRSFSRHRRLSALRFGSTLTLLFILLAGMRPMSAQGVWTVTNLHPESANASEVTSLNGAQAGGNYYTDSGSVATVWAKGAGADWTAADLPATGGNPRLLAVSGPVAVGVVNDDDDQAVVWNYDAGSTTWTMTNLNPVGAGYSSARAISGNQVGGYAYFGGGGTQAVVWTGTDSTPQNINPTGAALSAVHAMSGTQLAGTARLGGDHAVLWLTAGNTVVDLHPVGYVESRVTAMTATQQGGAIQTSGHDHAALWSGTAESVIDLGGSFVDSEITAMIDGFQVGYTDQGAALWMGSAESYIDLNPFVTALFGDDYNYAVATSIGVEDGILYIGGYVTDFSYGVDVRAFIMSASVSSLTAVPEPSSYAVLVGVAVLGCAIRRRRAKRS